MYEEKEWEKRWTVRPRGRYTMTTSGPDIGRTRLDERYVRRMPFGSWTMIMISLTEAFVGR